MEIAELVLEYLKAVVTFPVLLAGLAIYFRQEFRGILGRVARIRLPGGGEVEISQLDRSRDEIRHALPAEPELLEAGASSMGAGQVVETEGGVAGTSGAVGVGEDVAGGTPSENEAETLRQQVRAMTEAAAMWEFRYLNRFLVRRTQLMLQWFADREDFPPTLLSYDALFSDSIPDARERTAVLDALLQHHLVQRVDGLLKISNKGKLFLQWRGPLPDLPEPLPDDS